MEEHKGGLLVRSDDCGKSFRFNAGRHLGYTPQGCSSIGRGLTLSQHLCSGLQTVAETTVSIPAQNNRRMRKGFYEGTPQASPPVVPEPTGLLSWRFWTPRAERLRFRSLEARALGTPESRLCSAFSRPGSNVNLIFGPRHIQPKFRS